MSSEHSATHDNHKDKDAKGATGAISLATYSWSAALAALVGYGAVYVIAAPSDNGVYGARATTHKEVTKRPVQRRKSITKRYNKGTMAAFVYKKQPKILPKVLFADINSKPKTLDDWRGKVILVNVWATWCSPCRREMPDLDQLQAQLGSDQFEVVALSIDRKGVKAAKRFLDQINVKHLKTYNDATTRMAGKLNIIGMPTTLLIDRQGREVGRLIGPAKWDSKDAIALIKAQIAVKDQIARRGLFGN